jgi:dTDP-4-amino-4,6-dideoxygalactose transaminase
LIRLNLEQFPGLTKSKFVKALDAEGIPCSAGYPHPLYKNQVFDDYQHIRNDCPEAERMCADSFWLSHEIMLSEPDNLNDVASAIEKIVTGIDDLTSGSFDN